MFSLLMKQLIITYRDILIAIQTTLCCNFQSQYPFVPIDYFVNMVKPLWISVTQPLEDI